MICGKKMYRQVQDIYLNRSKRVKKDENEVTDISTSMKSRPKQGIFSLKWRLQLPIETDSRATYIPDSRAKTMKIVRYFQNDSTVCASNSQRRKEWMRATTVP